MLDWIDAKLLALTEKLVKKFNWLTGKDNFWLARKVCVYGCVAVLFCLFLAIIVVIMESFVLLGIFTLLLSLLLIAIVLSNNLTTIKIVEKTREKELMSGVKQLSLEMELKTKRLGRIQPIFFHIALAILFNSEISVVFLNISYMILFASMVASIYIASVEKPPYAKSQVGAWLKSLVAIPKLVPIRVGSS